MQTNDPARGMIMATFNADLPSPISPALVELVKFLARLAARDGYEALLRQQESSKHIYPESEAP